MNKIAIAAQRDFLERLSTAHPIRAISELIWNGLDAGTDDISVRLECNSLEGLEKIRVVDHGSGIDYSQIGKLFGDLGNSWKKERRRFKGRALHGKNGQGRFKAFSLGSHVEWITTYEANGKRSRYEIFGRADALTDLRYSDPVEAKGESCGTEVVVSGIDRNHGALLSNNAQVELAKIFAAYLSQYPDVSINYNGVRIDPAKLQSSKKDIVLDDIKLPDGEAVTATVTVVEWLMPTKRTIHLCDADGVCLHEIEAGQKIRAPGFEFTAYIRCNHFRELDKTGVLALETLHPDVAVIVQAARREVAGYFRRKLFEQQSQIVERWKQEEIYPFQDQESLNSVEEAERQVFDILAVNVESYLPAFEEADNKSKRFMFRLLAQALHDNPESVQRIITEMLNLKKEEQEVLADLLEYTSLSSIISSARTVADRLNFLMALENLVFDKATKVKLLERDQLHKILENEAWIFDEEFALSGSEKSLEEVLATHLGKIRDKADKAPVLRESGQQGRVDLMFSRVVQPRHDERDHLVVELKRPSQPINSEILSQVESYALAVAQDPRFLKTKTRWRFVVVSNTMDGHAKRKANQRERPSGLVFDDSDLNIKVWAFDWTDIISKARARLQFINDFLKFEASRETSKAYLERVHAKFIPIVEEPGQDDSDADIDNLDGNTSVEFGTTQSPLTP